MSIGIVDTNVLIELYRKQDPTTPTHPAVTVFTVYLNILKSV